MKRRDGLTTRVLFAALLLIPTAIMSSMAANRDFHSKIVVRESTLPDRIPGWEAVSVPLTDSEKSMLDSPAASQRLYTNSTTGDQVQILVLQVNNTQNAHDPKLCMAGSGYALDGERVQPAPWSSGAEALPVNRAEFSKGNARVTMFYWLQTPDGSIADMSGGFKLEGIRKALMGSTVKGVAVRVIALPNNRSQSQATDPKVAENLWQKVSSEIRFDRLIAGM